jgi:hypothetical protein
VTRRVPRIVIVGLTAVFLLPIINTAGRLFGPPEPTWTLITVSGQLVGLAVVLPGLWRLVRAADDEDDQ